MKSIWMVVLAVLVASMPGESLARGGRGGGGGGGGGRSFGGGGGGGRSFSGGGGGARNFSGGGGNFGGGARATGHAPSFSQPSGGGFSGGNRVGGGGAGERFGGGGAAGINTRPAGGAGFGAGGAGERFGGGGAAGINTRPAGGAGFGAGGAGAAGGRFGAGGAGERFNGGGAANRPADGFRPDGGNTFNRGGNDNFANRSGNFNNNNRNFNNISGNNINVNRGGYGGYGGYGGWYHGNWHPNAGWNGGGYRPWGWGWGGSGFGWGVGAGLLTAGLVAAVSPWNWGYYGYSNPYWSGGGGSTYINYSQPIVATAPLDTGLALADDGTAPDSSAIADNSAAPAPTTDQDQAMAIFEGARGQFTAGDYAGALAATDNAIKLQPNDPVLHEFRALCLFAQGEYQQSAAAIYAVLSGGPGWDWTTVSSLYPSVAVYTKQLRVLEKYSQEHPDAADARFLLAYQYLLTGHNDAASAELKQVVALQPNDTLSAQLLKSISPAADGTAPGPGSAPASAPASTPAGKPVDAATLVGDWTASRPDGTKVEMDLSDGKQFSWRFAQGGKPQELKGTYTLADNYLVLKASEQNALVGQVGLLANNQLSFRLADDNPADPGLVFKK